VIDPEKFILLLDLRCGFCLELFWHVAKVIVIVGLLADGIEFEISLGTLYSIAKLMLSLSLVFVLNHSVLASVGFL
jgi:hypothetical protein